MSNNFGAINAKKNYECSFRVRFRESKKIIKKCDIFGRKISSVCIIIKGVFPAILKKN